VPTSGQPAVLDCMGLCISENRLITVGVSATHPLAVSMLDLSDHRRGLIAWVQVQVELPHGGLPSLFYSAVICEQHLMLCAAREGGGGGGGTSICMEGLALDLESSALLGHTPGGPLPSPCSWRALQGLVPGCSPSGGGGRAARLSVAYDRSGKVLHVVGSLAGTTAALTKAAGAGGERASKVPALPAKYFTLVRSLTTCLPERFPDHLPSRLYSLPSPHLTWSSSCMLLRPSPSS
jgi:hypothetical protein